jgi:hypothetical protein
LIIEFPSNGFNQGTFGICYFEYSNTLSGFDDAHYIRQTSSILISNPTVTSMSVLNSNPNQFLNDQDIRFKLTGTNINNHRIAIISTLKKGCTGASTASSTINSINEILFASISIDCISLPCNLKVCHSAASSGDDGTFSDQGINNLQLVKNTIHSSLYMNMGSCTSCGDQKFAFVGNHGSYLSIGNNAINGCYGASSSSYKSKLSCTNAKTHCLHSWSSLPSNPTMSSRTLCHATSSSNANADTSYVQQNIPLQYLIYQDQLSILKTNGPRIRTIYSEEENDYLYIVGSDGTSNGIIRYSKFDGSNPGNLLHGDDNLNQPWGFVSSPQHYFIGENGGNRIRRYGREPSSVYPTAVGSQLVMWNDVCSIGNPRSLDVAPTFTTSNLLYYVCSDGSNSELRSIDTTTGSHSRIGRYTGEIKDLSILGMYAYIARGTIGITRIVLSTGAASGELMTGFDTHFVMSIATVNDRVYFIDYQHDIQYPLRLYELNVETSLSFEAKPIGIIDFSELGKDHGTPFLDIYLTARSISNAKEFYLQQSWRDPNETYESAIAKVKQV